MRPTRISVDILWGCPGYHLVHDICKGKLVRLLVDGDVLCYRAAFATEKTKYLVQGQGDELVRFFDDHKTAKAAMREFDVLWSRKDVKPEAEAIDTVDAMVSDICRQLEGNASDVVMVLSGVGNFRHKIATRADYKGNRSSERPKNYGAVREHLTSKWKAVVSVGEEADDLLGIELTRDPNSVCCSIDKDLRQLPGWHYDFTTDELAAVTPRQGDLSFFCQVLSGDAVDNVPGLTGIGKVKAKSAMAACHSPAECWDVCVEMYRNEFGKTKGAKYALETARLVYVRRKPKEIWSPTLADGLMWDDVLTTPSPRKPIEFSPIKEEG